ncbi:hypothetical protein ABIC94_002117 [Variovorax paradoxus]|uniref:hypothetical protein n=1 Tax=Variovorax paradoxus TaxID=34073 RepID=UPI00339486BD
MQQTVYWIANIRPLHQYPLRNPQRMVHLRYLSFSILALSFAIAGCSGISVKRGYEGPELGEHEVATLTTPDPDIGFRIDRTTFNQRPTALLSAVNHFEVGSRNVGYPTTTKILPGRASIRVRCLLPTPPHRAQVFATVYTSADITLNHDFAAGATYNLRCEPLLAERVRAWVEKVQ